VVGPGERLSFTWSEDDKLAAREMTVIRSVLGAALRPHAGRAAETIDSLSTISTREATVPPGGLVWVIGADADDATRMIPPQPPNADDGGSLLNEERSAVRRLLHAGCYTQR